MIKESAIIIIHTFHIMMQSSLRRSEHKHADETRGSRALFRKEQERYIYIIYQYNHTYTKIIKRIVPVFPKALFSSTSNSHPNFYHVGSLIYYMSFGEHDRSLANFMSLVCNDVFKYTFFNGSPVLMIRCYPF
jgi:hypothetical protein